MRVNRITTRTLAALTMWAGLAGTAAAQVKTEDVLSRKPIQPGVAVYTPTAAEAGALRTEQVTWPKSGDKTPTGVVTKDAQGRLVRQFIDTNGTGRPNIWSFYLNGAEVYREVDGNGNGKPDQYRWLGPNGSKWGIDVDEDGVVDTWHVISPEEASQELFQAMLTRDAKRLQALMPSAQDLASLGLPAADAAKIKDKMAGAAKRMQDTAEAMKLTEKAKWIHLEVGPPHTTPADAFGGRDDVVRQRTATVLVDKGDGKAEVFQTGEMVLIGRSWKLVEGPAVGPAGPEGAGDTEIPPFPKEIVELVAKLNQFAPPTTPDEMPKYHQGRATILEEIVAKTQGAQQEPWLRQLVDAYASLAEVGQADGPAMARLKQWQTQMVQSKSPLAAYAAFRVLSAEYAFKLKDSKEVMKAQEWWRKSLTDFINKYPSAPEDTPEAMNRLAQACEFAGKDGEAEAKTWYAKLAKDFPNHVYATKAQGSVRRLDSEGQPFALAGQTLDGKEFNVAQLAGKPALVYYWASWGQNAAGELKQLADLQKANAGKLEIVTVSLDTESAKAVQTINAAQLTGTHLFAPGGLDSSPLATSYGIQMVPHVFLIGKDGKVVNRNAQVGPSLASEVEKLTK